MSEEPHLLHGGASSEVSNVDVRRDRTLLGEFEIVPSKEDTPLSLILLGDGFGEFFSEDTLWLVSPLLSDITFKPSSSLSSTDKNLTASHLNT